MLPGNTPALFGAAVPGNDAFTKLLLHCNGANASTVFTDASLSAKGNASVFGNAQISTAQSKFGGASALFDGAGDYLQYPNHADWNFGAGNFTIDWWERRTAATAGCPVVARDGAVTFTHWVCGYSNGSNAMLIYMSSNGSSWDVANGQSLGALELNVWHHFAIVRSGNTFYGFRDGVQTATWTSTATFGAATGSLAIGMWSSQFFPGYIDELRISKGIARWTTNFTPPTAPYS